MPILKKIIIHNNAKEVAVLDSELIERVEEKKFI
jgi:hypothetical protein